MIPNIHIYERLMVERHQERQQEMAHYRQAKEALRHRPGRGSRFVARLGTLFLARRTRQSRVAPAGEQVGYEHSSTYSGVQQL